MRVVANFIGQGTDPGDLIRVNFKIGSHKITALVLSKEAEDDMSNNLTTVYLRLLTCDPLPSDPHYGPKFTWCWLIQVEVMLSKRRYVKIWPASRRSSDLMCRSGLPSGRIKIGRKRHFTGSVTSRGGHSE